MWFARGNLGKEDDFGDEVWRILISEDERRVFIVIIV